MQIQTAFPIEIPLPLEIVERLRLIPLAERATLVARILEEHLPPKDPTP